MTELEKLKKAADNAYVAGGSGYIIYAYHAVPYIKALEAKITKLEKADD